MKKLTQQLLLVISAVLFPTLVSGQCIYNAVQNGNISSASTFMVSPGTCSATPVSGSASIINLNGFDVAIDVNYTIGNGGAIVTGTNQTLTITANQTLTVALGGTLTAAGGLVEIDKDGRLVVQTGGKVMGGNISLGNGAGSQGFTNLEIQLNTATNGVNAVTVDELRINKGTVVISPNATLQTNCNLVLESTSFTNGGIVIVRGNLDLSGGNNTTCGSGTFAVRGCVFASQGQINQLVCRNNTPTFCASQRNVGCPGPVKNNLSCFTPSGNDPVVTSGPGCVPLPVELAEFIAQPNDRQQVDVRWTTASEKNSATFVLERSGDGQSFRKVHAVAAAGTSNSPTRYALVDEQPLPNTSYYRLRQADFDGTTTYSPVRAVKLRNLNTALQVYPGLTAQQWVVSSSLPADMMPGAVQVLDMLGRLQKAPCTPNDAYPGRWTLDLQAVPTGVYIVRLLTSGGTFSQRIAK